MCPLTEPDSNSAKRCTQCDDPKPLEDFPRTPRTKDGRGTICKLCKREQEAERRRKQGILTRAEIAAATRGAAEVVRQRRMREMGATEGVCACGECNRSTSIATSTHTAKGVVKGKPLFFATGCSTSSGAWWTRYEVRDTGYRTGPCWFWTGHLNPYGYPMLRRRGRLMLIHREMLKRETGEAIAPGMEVHHCCTTRACIRPDHLEPRASGTHNLHALLAERDREIDRLHKVIERLQAENARIIAA